MIIKPCYSFPETFLELKDTPNSYAGAREYFLKVNSSENGIVFEPLNIINNIIYSFENIDDLKSFDTTDLENYIIAYVRQNNTFYYLVKNGVSSSNLTTYGDFNVYSLYNGIWVNTEYKTIYFTNTINTIQDGTSSETAFNIDTNRIILINSVINNLNIICEGCEGKTIKIHNPNLIKNITLLLNETNVFKLEFVIDRNDSKIDSNNLIESIYINHKGTGSEELTFSFNFTTSLFEYTYLYINNLHYEGKILNINFDSDYLICKIKELSGFIEGISQIPFNFIVDKSNNTNTTIKVSPFIAFRTDETYIYNELINLSNLSPRMKLQEPLKILFSRNRPPLRVLLFYEIVRNIPPYYNLISTLPFYKIINSSQILKLIMQEYSIEIPNCCVPYDPTRGKFILEPGKSEIFIIDNFPIISKINGFIILYIMVDGTIKIESDNLSINETINNGTRYYLLLQRSFSNNEVSNYNNYITLINQSPTENAYYRMKVIYSFQTLN